MCEYCGCQSIKAIAELTAEHDSVVDLISVVRAAHHGADAAEMARVARLITAILLPHTQVEEHGLFPAMSDEFPEQIAALEDEHRRIEKVLGEAADGVPADPGWPSRLVSPRCRLPLRGRRPYPQNAPRADTPVSQRPGQVRLASYSWAQVSHNVWWRSGVATQPTRSTAFHRSSVVPGTRCRRDGGGSAGSRAPLRPGAGVHATSHPRC